MLSTSLPDIFNTPFIFRSWIHPDIVLGQFQDSVVINWRDPGQLGQQWRISGGGPDEGFSITNVAAGGVLAGGDVGSYAIVASPYNPALYGCKWKGQPVDGNYQLIELASNPGVRLAIDDTNPGALVPMRGGIPLPNMRWQCQPVTQVERNPSTPDVLLCLAFREPGVENEWYYQSIKGNRDRSCALGFAWIPGKPGSSNPPGDPSNPANWDPACLWTLDRWQGGVSFRNQATGRLMLYKGNNLPLDQTDVMSLASLFTVLDVHDQRLKYAGFAFRPFADSNQAVAVLNEGGWKEGSIIRTTDDWSGSENFDKKWALNWIGRTFANRVENGWPAWQ